MLGMQQSQDALGQKKSTENEGQWTERGGGHGGRIFGSKSQTKDLDSHCEKGFLCLDGICVTPHWSLIEILGTPGGARLGREGTWGGGALKGSGEAPGLDGTGGAPAVGGPGAVRPPGRGGPGGARRWGVGLDIGDLRPEGPPCTCSQESSTGGGMVVEIVVVLMSPMMPRASLRAWYMRSISSLC